MTIFATISNTPMAFDTCPSCRILHGFPRSMYDLAKARNESFRVTCPNGHHWHYKSQREIRQEELVRQERDRLRQLIAEREDEIADAKKQIASARGQVTRLKNRASAGLCPCCNRHFDNLQRHMASKHPAEETKAGRP